MEVKITSNALEVAESLPRAALAMRDRAHRAVVVHGALLQATVKRNANEPRTTARPGPGGPRLLTGNYNRSIRRISHRLADRSIASVGTNAPQALRLEHGFHGEDSLGRHFEQKPYPHFGPAMDEVGPKFLTAVTELLIVKDATP